MEVIKLNESHAEMIKPFFYVSKYMGMNKSIIDSDSMLENFQETSYNSFCDTYISDLNNYKSFGSIEHGEVTSLIGFYESTDTAEWYGTHIKSKNKKAIPYVLDKVMEFNESNGRLKFYSMFNSKYKNSYRKLCFSEIANERYDYFDEFIVPSKMKCIYLAPWQVLYTRTLIPVDTLVRCSFLKQKYRKSIHIAGNI